MVEMTEQQAIAKLQMNEQQFNQIQKKINSIGGGIDELKMTIATLINLPTNGENGFLPLGGAYIPVKMTDAKINLNIGSGIIAEKDREEAISILKQRKKDLTNTLNKLQNSVAKLRNESMIIQKKLKERNQQSNVPVISG